MKNVAMSCKEFREELPDLVMVPGTRLSLVAAAHLRDCPPCTEEYLSFQQTLGALDAWAAPPVSPYFDQKVQVRVREAQAAPAMGWFERLGARLAFNTGRGFRPAMVSALALVLVAGGGGIAGLSGMFNAPSAPQASATVQDLQILDRNEQALQTLDELQQDEDSAAAADAAGQPSS